MMGKKDMITEAYVSYETAKLLKEKGFDEPCREYYFTQQNGLHKGRYTFNRFPLFNVENDDWTLKCPTLALAERWLREMLDRYIQVDFDGFGYFTYKIWNTKTYVIKRCYNHYLTYEQALESGFFEALKMI